MDPSPGRTYDSFILLSPNGGRRYHVSDPRYIVAILAAKFHSLGKAGFIVCFTLLQVRWCVMGTAMCSMDVQWMFLVLLQLRSEHVRRSLLVSSGVSLTFLSLH